MEQYTFNIAGGVARNPLVRLAQPVTAQIATGEHIAIVGPNGGGKSFWVNILCVRVHWTTIFLLLLPGRYMIT